MFFAAHRHESPLCPTVLHPTPTSFPLNWAPVTCWGGTPAPWGAAAEPAPLLSHCLQETSFSPQPTAGSTGHRFLSSFSSSAQRRRCGFSPGIPVASVTPPGSLVSLPRPANAVRSGTSEGHGSVKRSHVTAQQPLTLTRERCCGTKGRPAGLLTSLTCGAGGAELLRFPQRTQTTAMFKASELFTSGVLHEVFLDQCWPQTTETWESETGGCGLGVVALLYLIS